MTCSLVPCLVLALLALFSSVRAAHISTRQNVVTIAPPTPSSECSIDSICFAIDQSGSIVNYGFYDEEQQFVIDLSLEISKRTTGVQYSVYGFSDTLSEIQNSTTVLETEFIAAVRDKEPSGGGTSLSIGLKRCSEEVGSSNGTRVVVLVTDGADMASGNAVDVAEGIKSEGISIVTVGIGKRIKEEDLEKIATTPDFFIKSTFSELASDVLKVTESSCDVVEVTPAPPAPPPPEPVVDVCKEAYDFCGFYFANENDVPSFSMDGPDNVPFTPIVQSRNMNERLGILNTNDIMVEIIGDDRSVTEITSLPASQQFSSTQFKPFTWSNGKGSGIGHETFQLNQKEVVRGRCVRVYFSQFQLLQLSAPFNVVSNEVAGRKDNKCVVFRTV